jgi:hypothetical protein
MSHKQAEDKEKEGFPWTARQKRRLKGNRKTRKVAAHDGNRKARGRKKGGGFASS